MVAGRHREAASDSYPHAGVAQLVEQLIRNQQVIGSSPIAGSKFRRQVRLDSPAASLARAAGQRERAVFDRSERHTSVARSAYEVLDPKDVLTAEGPGV